MKATVYPILYRHVVIRVPLEFSDLSSLESLASSAGEGLRCTVKLSILAMHFSAQEAAKTHEADVDEVCHRTSKYIEIEEILPLPPALLLIGPRILVETRI